MTSSKLLENGTVISFDDATQSLKVLHNHSILVTGDRIAAIFPSSSRDSIDIPQYTEFVDVTDKIVSPGFVDTHHHGWMSAFKTLAANTTLAENFPRYSHFSQARTVFTPDDIYHGQLASLHESLNAGVTTILDHFNAAFTPAHTTASLTACTTSGARIWWCYALDSPSSLSTFSSLQSTFPHTSPLLSLGLAYDGCASTPPSVTLPLLSHLRTHPPAVFTTHSLAGPWHFDNGPSTLAAHGLLPAPWPTVISHAGHLSPADAALLRRHNAHVSITPESEMHYGHDHPAAVHVLDQASLGVDTHSTFSGDMVGQARLWLQTVRRAGYRRVLEGWGVPATNPMGVEEAFLLATRKGGVALGREDVGVVRVGAVADLVVFGGRSPGMLGWGDAVAAVVLHSSVGDVEEVMVGGEWRKRGGVLVDKGVGEEGFLESVRRIQKIWRETPLPVLEGEYRPGVPYVKTEEVKVVRKEQGN